MGYMGILLQYTQSHILLSQWVLSVLKKLMSYFFSLWVLGHDVTYSIFLGGRVGGGGWVT